MATYRKRRHRFPLKIPWGPRVDLVSKYEELRLDVIPPPREEGPRQPMDIGYDLGGCRQTSNDA